MLVSKRYFNWGLKVNVECESTLKLIPSFCFIMETLEIKIYTIAECRDKIQDCEEALEKDRRLPESKWKRWSIEQDTQRLTIWEERERYCTTHRIEEVAVYKGKMIDHTKWNKIVRSLED